MFDLSVVVNALMDCWIADYPQQITFLPVEQNGIVSMEKLKAAIRPDTLMVSVMAVNNEIGVVQPLKEIGEFCRSNKILFHTDAAQVCNAVMRVSE